MANFYNLINCTVLFFKRNVKIPRFVLKYKIPRSSTLNKVEILVDLDISSKNDIRSVLECRIWLNFSIKKKKKIEGEEKGHASGPPPQIYSLLHVLWCAQFWPMALKLTCKICQMNSTGILVML